MCTLWIQLPIPLTCSEVGSKSNNDTGENNQYVQLKMCRWALMTRHEKDRIQRVKIRRNHTRRLWNNMFYLGRRLVFVQPLAHGVVELQLNLIPRSTHRLNSSKSSFVRLLDRPMPGTPPRTIARALRGHAASHCAMYHNSPARCFSSCIHTKISRCWSNVSAGSLLAREPGGPWLRAIWSFSRLENDWGLVLRLRGWFWCQRAWKRPPWGAPRGSVSAQPDPRGDGSRWKTDRRIHTDDAWSPLREKRCQGGPIVKAGLLGFGSGRSAARRQGLRVDFWFLRGLFANWRDARRTNGSKYY
jgi:hypothetical protein